MCCMHWTFPSGSEQDWGYLLAQDAVGFSCRRVDEACSQGNSSPSCTSQMAAAFVAVEMPD